jgi:HemY protein
MRRAIWLLLIVSAAVGIALLLRVAQGNVAILWPPYRVDLSVNLALLLLAILFLLLHLLFIALSNALNLPGRVREYRDRRRRDKALEGLRDSLLAFFEGRFGRAERLARGALSDQALAGSAALIGARAAQKMRETERRDRWLESAQSVGEIEAARQTTVAEIALDEHRPADALAALDGLGASGARHLHAMRLALRAHTQAEAWPQVLELVRLLERRDAIDAPQAQALRVRALRALFAGAGDDPDLVKRVLDEVPAAEREIDEVALAAVRALSRAGLHSVAARIVERVLAKRFDADLVELWPELTGVPGRERLARAESWLQRWGEEPALLVALGRVCAAEELWGKAEEFLLRAERRRPDPSIRALLGQLCERLGRPDDAARWYRQATLAAYGDEMVRLSSTRSPELPAEDEREDGTAVLPIPGP